MSHSNMSPEAEQSRKENLSRIKNKLVVISGKGGVGKSTVTVNLAYGLALKGFKVGILDVDIHGPSIPKMLGIEGRQLSVSESGEKPAPVKVHENLWALSVATFLPDNDEPIIWRGPMKMGAIRQFMQDIEWPQLDYLLVDCPPGTGDEPLSAIQVLEDVKGAVIVSTPQDVAFLDVRKSINFAHKLELNVLGLVQNMSGFACPHCGERIDIFKGDGAAKATVDFNIDLLGDIPIDQNIVKCGDSGRPYIYDFAKLDAAKIMDSIVEKVVTKTN